MKKSLLIGTLSAIIIFGGASVNAQSNENYASASRIVNFNECPKGNEDCPRINSEASPKRDGTGNVDCDGTGTPKRDGTGNVNGTGTPKRDGTGNGTPKRDGTGKPDCDGTHQGQRNKQN
ncbi:MAG: hypothetical protein RR646_00540 [Erysipelotrichaceae bacterium]